MRFVPHPAEVFPNETHFVSLWQDSGWLVIPRTDESAYKRDEDMACLRALSQTCRRLRTLALPILWSLVCISTVDELGRCVDAFRDMPGTASYVQRFSFTWCMNGDWNKMEPYADEYGSLLDMAFIDRGEAWDRVWEAAKPRKYPERVQSFQHEGRNYQQPGLRTSSEKQAANLDRSGPDGLGEDQRINNPNKFNEAISEIVVQLKSLTAFSWRSPVTAPPSGVLEALLNAPQLEDLGLLLDTRRRYVPAGMFLR